MRPDTTRERPSRVTGAPRSVGEEALRSTVHRSSDKLAPQYVLHFQARVLQDALVEATAMYWKRRAEALEKALPRVGDFTGAATPEDLQARSERLQEAIAACRRRANLTAARAIGVDDSAEDILNVLREAS